jgi:hypothetical protein
VKRRNWLSTRALLRNLSKLSIRYYKRDTISYTDRCRLLIGYTRAYRSVSYQLVAELGEGILKGRFV